MSTSGPLVSSPPPYDGGVQDALLATAYRCLGRSVSGLSSERSTDSPFDDSPPRLLRSARAREVLGTVVTCTASASLAVDSYWTDGVANPNVELVMEGPRAAGTETIVQARVGRPSSPRPIPDGTYQVHLRAHVYTFPGYRAHLRQWARTPLWPSDTAEITLRPGERLIARAQVPAKRLRTTASERAFFAGEVFPGSRVNLLLGYEVRGEH